VFRRAAGGGGHQFAGGSLAGKDCIPHWSTTPVGGLAAATVRTPSTTLPDHRRPVGVLDERTIALEWPPGPLGARRTPGHTLLRDRLRPRVRGGDDLGRAARTMLGARADAVPVVDRDGWLFGLITLWHFAELAAEGGREEAPRAITARSTGEGSPQ
jgi:CBS domain-containing protein